MKLPRVLFAVLGLHVGAITLLVLQPGCQSTRQKAMRPKEDSKGMASTTAPSKPAESGSRHGFSDEVVSSSSLTGQVDPAFNAGIGTSTSNSRPSSGSAGRFAPTRPERPLDEPTVSSAGGPLAASSLSSPSNTTLWDDTNAGKADLDQPAGSAGVYTIKRGDSLWKVANKHGVTLDALLKANGLNRKSVIHPGQELTIPSGGSSAGTSTVRRNTGNVPTPVDNYDGELYIVMPGDSLSVIAKKFRTSVDAVKRVNGLTNNRIYAGQTLKLPDGVEALPMHTPTSVNRKEWSRREGQFHTVGPGETLGKIARRYNVSVKELMDLNNISNPKLLRAGQEIMIRRGASGDVVPADPGAPILGTSPSVTTDPALSLENIDDIPRVDEE